MSLRFVSSLSFRFLCPRSSRLWPNPPTLNPALQRSDCSKMHRRSARARATITSQSQPSRMLFEVFTPMPSAIHSTHFSLPLRVVKLEDSLLLQALLLLGERTSRGMTGPCCTPSRSTGLQSSTVGFSCAPDAAAASPELAEVASPAGGSGAAAAVPVALESAAASADAGAAAAAALSGGGYSGPGA
jgi:hypothetical protein